MEHFNVKKKKTPSSCQSYDTQALVLQYKKYICTHSFMLGRTEKYVYMNIAITKHISYL